MLNTVLRGTESKGFEALLGHTFTFPLIVVIIMVTFHCKIICSHKILMYQYFMTANNFVYSKDLTCLIMTVDLIISLSSSNKINEHGGEINQLPAD